MLREVSGMCKLCTTIRKWSHIQQFLSVRNQGVSFNTFFKTNVDERDHTNKECDPVRLENVESLRRRKLCNISLRHKRTR